MTARCPSSRSTSATMLRCGPVSYRAEPLPRPGHRPGATRAGASDTIGPHWHLRFRQAGKVARHAARLCPCSGPSGRAREPRSALVRPCLHGIRRWCSLRAGLGGSRQGGQHYGVRRLHVERTRHRGPPVDVAATRPPGRERGIGPARRLRGDKLFRRSIT